jgi:hypothetical protein
MSKGGDAAHGEGPFANVVSFAEKAREHGREIGHEFDAHLDELGQAGLELKAASAGRDGMGGPGVARDSENGAAELTREAMQHRLGELTKAQAARGAVDEELARLVFDSESGRAEHDGIAAIRSVDSHGSATRSLTFEGPDLLLEVQVDARSRELTLQLVPPQPATLEIRHSRGSIDLGRDEFGTFFALELPAGAVSFRCVPLTGRAAPTATSWLTL